MTDQRKSPSEMKVLVIDDHPLTRNLVKSILKSFGFEVSLAESGSIAADIYKRDVYDCIICDWNMPNMTGLEFLQFVRKLPEDKSEIPFVMLTAEAYKENVSAAIKAGATDYVVKPFTAEILLSKISDILKI